MGTAGIYTAFLYYGYLQEDVLMFKNAQGEQYVLVSATTSWCMPTPRPR